MQQIRYLGVVIICASKFKCDFSERRKSYYRAFNAVYGRLGRNASCEVVIELIKKKCLPILWYGCEAAPMYARDFNSFDFVVKSSIPEIKMCLVIVVQCFRWSALKIFITHGAMYFAVN